MQERGSRNVERNQSQAASELIEIARRARHPRLSVVIVFRADQHAAIKITTNHHRADMTHAATVFAETEYGRNDEPKEREIKVDEPKLTNENISAASIRYLHQTFPATQDFIVKIYNTFRDYKDKNASNVYSPQPRANADYLS